ncbi:hypothetical protein [Promicromonospora sp. NPDC023805]|uniref:hypothetical protein n=1 Tax=Promicromonospora sp. NPDC023805 TaxID=3154696 RepID=UPI00340ABE8F
MNQPSSQQPPVFAPDATLSFTVQGSVMTSNLVAPTLTIDGHLAPLPIVGNRTFAIMSGRHRLQVHSQWMRRYGHAAIDVDIAPGQTLEVFYAPPYHQFSDDGAMGLNPQARKGRGFLVGTWAFVVLLVFVMPALMTAIVLASD